MPALSIAPLTRAGFAPFGEVIETADVNPKLINEGFAERFDDLANIDVAYMTRAIQSLIAPARWLANSTFRPEWVPGGQPAR